MGTFQSINVKVGQKYLQMAILADLIISELGNLCSEFFFHFYKKEIGNLQKKVVKSCR